MAISKIVRHASNPFMPLLLKQSKKGQSFTKYSTEDSSKFMILDTDTLSAKPVSVFGSSQEVEINNFVKLYADGVGGIMGLSNPGKKVFAVLYLQVGNFQDSNLRHYLYGLLFVLPSDDFHHILVTASNYGT